MLRLHLLRMDLLLLMYYVAKCLVRSFFAGWLKPNFVDNGRTRGYNEQMIDANGEYNMLAIDNRDWWNKFWGSIGSNPIDNIPNLENISPIKLLEDDDFNGTNDEISNRLFVNASEVPALREYYTSRKMRNEDTYLFRFAVTDYRSSKMYLFDKGNNPGSCNGMLAQQTIFFNFDIIELTFKKEGKYTVIPVVSSPLNVFGDITSPQDFDGIDWAKILKIIVGVVLGILLFIILLPLLPHIISLLISIIKLPFILLGKLFGGIGKLFRKKGKSEKKVRNK